MGWGFGCRNPRKRRDAAFFEKTRTGGLSRVPEKFFGKFPGKVCGEIVPGKIQKIFFVCEKFFLEKSLQGNPRMQFKLPQYVKSKSDF